MSPQHGGCDGLEEQCEMATLSAPSGSPTCESNAGFSMRQLTNTHR
jgi:hypothetical protein